MYKWGKASAAGAAAGMGEVASASSSRSSRSSARRTLDRPPHRRGRTRGRTGQRPSCGSTPGRRALGTRRDRWPLARAERARSRTSTRRRAPSVAADPLPISEIALVRCSKLLADCVELDDDGALSLAAPVCDIVLNDRDRLGAAPPVRGVGGVVVLLVPWFPPRARVGRRGFCRGFRRAFAGVSGETVRS